jgi:YD repeat-containing protein
MVAIVSGSNLGVNNSSLAKLGQQGVYGTASQGSANAGAFVNVADGNLVLQDLDNTLAGLGGGIATLRTYNSQGAVSWRIGAGSQSLSPVADGQANPAIILLYMADGSQRTFHNVGGASYEAADLAGGVADTLVRQADGSYLLTNGSTGEKEIYAGSGGYHLLETIDANGNATSYGYGGNGLLASVTDANGETVYYDYDSNNNVVGLRSVVSNGQTSTTTRVVTYTYDAQNRLTSASVDLDPTSGSSSVYTTTYTYDGSSNRVASVTQSDGTTLSFSYVQIGANYEVASVTDGNGATTTFSYDPGHLQTIVTDGAGNVTTYQYDTFGNLTNVLTDNTVGSTTTSTPVSRFSYDSSGRVIQAWNAGTVTQYTYAGIDGPLTGVSQWQAPLGASSPGSTMLQSQAAYTVAANGKVLTSTVYANPGSLDGSIAPTGALTTRNVFDANGNLVFQVSPDGDVVEYVYASNGLLQSTIKYTGSTFNTSGYAANQAPTQATMAAWVASLGDLSNSTRTDFTYDARGQLASSTTYAATLSNGSGDSSSAATTHYVYAPNGELISTVLPTGAQTAVTYDGLGRVLTQTDALGHTTVTQYDDAQRSVTVTTADGTQTVSVHDAAGRIVSVSHVSQGQSLGATLYQYDADGHLLMTQDPTGARTFSLYDNRGYKVADIDADGVLTQYVRDAAGRITSETTYATAVQTAMLVDGAGNAINPLLSSVLPAASAQDETTTFEYDGQGRVVREISPAGVATDTVYDGASRILSQTTYATPVGATGVPVASANDRTIRHFYDADGNVIGTIDAAGTLTAYRYDAGGRLIQTTTYGNLALTPGANDPVLADYLPNPDPQHDVTTYSIYNDRGQLVGQIDGDGYLTETVYDAAGNVARRIRYATAVSYTAGETLSAVRPATSASDEVSQYAYTPLNQLATETAPNGVVTQYVYDAMGRLVTTVSAAGTADVRTLTERYDALGRLVGELAGNGSAALAQATTQAQIDAVWAQYGVTYTYDAAGRRTSSTDADGHRTLFFYDADSRLTATVDALGEVTQTIYDAFGRATSTIEYGTRIDTVGLTGGVQTSDFTNRLASIRHAQLDVVTSYTYNADGTQASTTDALGNTTQYTYDSFGDRLSVTKPLDATHSVETDYTYDADGRLTSETDDALGIAARTATRYDAFGRVVATVDANGNTSTFAYDRDGQQIASTDALGHTSTVAYDAFGRVLSRTDALGATTTYAYNDATRTTTVISPDGVRLTTTLNEFGQTDTVTDGDGNATHYSYDANGNLIGVTTPLSHTSSRYDAANNLIATTNADGVVTNYSYDAANRVLARVVDPTGLRLATLYQYDALGRQVTTTDPLGVVTQTAYDLDGHTVSQTVDPTGLNLTTRYAYDAGGREVTVTSPGGLVTQYQYDDLGRRIAQTLDPSGAHLTTSYTYDANGNVLSRTDPAGNTSLFAYDADNREIYAVDAAGSVTATHYDADGRVSSTTSYATPISTSGLTPTAAAIAARIVANALRDQTQYNVYNADGQLTWTVDGAGAVTSRTYDGAGNVVRTVSYANRIDIANIGAPGFVPNPVIDVAHDRVTQTVYDALNRATYTLDGTGAVIETDYDAAGNVVSAIGYAARISPQTSPTQAAISAAVAAVANPAVDRHVRNVYDTAGRLSYSANGVGAVTHYVYDADGRVVRTIAYAQTISAAASPASVVASADDRVIDNVYDALGRTVWTVDPAGAVTHSVYDANGNVVQTVAYADLVAPSTTPYTAATLAAALPIDPQNDRVTTFAYDSANRLTLTVDALGDVTQNVYDATGHVIAKTQYATPLQGSLENAAASTITLAALTAQVQANPAADRTTRNVFDADGRARYTIDPLGYVTEMRYDGLGNIVYKTQYAMAVSLTGNPSAAQVAAAIVVQPASDRTSTFTYDAQGNLVASSDALGYTETYTYDGAGNKRSYTNKNGNTWTYDYDAAGNLTSQTSPQVLLTTVTQSAAGNISLDWNGATMAPVVTSYTYDAFGHVASMTEAAGRPEQRTTRYVYDAAGHQIRTIYPPTNVYAAAYDNLAANGQWGYASRVEYTNVTLSDSVYYNAFGDAVANVDTAGNVTLKSYDPRGQVTYSVDGDGYVTGYSRDAFGDVTRLVRFGQGTNLPSTFGQALATDTNGSAFSISTSQISAVVNAAGFDHSTDRAIETSYDRLGRAISVVDPQSFVYDSSTTDATKQYFSVGKTTHTSYDAFGNVTQTSVLVNSQTNTWNVTTQYYDKDGRNVASIDPLGYLTTSAYDAAGNLVAQTQYANATPNWNATSYTTPTPSAQDRTTVYAYDADNRKTSQTQVNATYSTASNGTSTVGNLATRYTYDAVGNLTSTTTPTGISTISYYDALGRVTAVAQGNTTGAGAEAALTQYYRDAYGNVLAQVQRAQGSNYATLAGYSATNSNNDRVTYNQYNNRGDVIASTDADGNTVYSSYTADDHLAKQWQNVSNNGVTSTWFEAYQYDADGNRVAVIDPASTSVLQSGVTTSYSSSQTVSAGESNLQNGTNSVTVNWSSLVNATGGSVRVDVYYNTISTLKTSTVPVSDTGFDEGGYNESGATQTITTGVGVQAQSRSATYAAWQVQGGATLSWNDQNAAVGGISALSYVRVWQQDPSGNWQVLWEGSPAQANGSGIAQVSQQQAGVDVQRTTYDAFGEVVSTGMDGGAQVYNQYDNAGNLWKTNSTNGVDTVYLYDLAGDRTATITSAGSASDNLNLRTIQSEQQAAGLTDVRRTDTVYDALAHAVKVIQPQQTVVYGGAQVGNLDSAAAIAQSAAFVPSGNSGTWNGNNQIDLSWPSLAGLGNGDIKVQVDYVTQAASYAINAYGESGAVTTATGENGAPIGEDGGTSGSTVTIAPVGGSRVFNFTAAQANGGAVVNWADSASSQTGGLSQVTGLTVWKMAADGQWHQVLHQSAANQNGSYITVGAPPDASTNVALQIAAAGSGQWQTVDPSQFVNFGDQYRFDASVLGYGSYDFRVLTTPAGAGGQASVTATGTLAIGSPQIAPVDIPMSFNRPYTPTGTLSWQSQGTGTTVIFNYKMAGSSTWQSLPVQDVGNGLQGVNTTGLPAGQYEYEVLYVRNGQWQPYGHSTGVITITAPVAARYVPPVGLPVITAQFSVSTASSGTGQIITGTDENGNPVYGPAPAGTNTNVLHWADAGGQTAVFQYQAAGSSTWSTLPVSVVGGTNESGYTESGAASTFYSVDLSGLPSGNYAFQVLYYSPGQGSPDAHATGVISVEGQVPGYYQTQYTTVTVPQTVYPPAPSNYIVGHDANGAAIYGAPVVVGYSGNTAIFGPGYTGGPGVVAVPYTVMEPQQQTQSVYVQGHYETQYVPVTSTPPAPSNYITGTDESGAPIYGAPVVVGYNEDGSAILGAGYTYQNGAIVAVPYTTEQAQSVWVNGYWTTQSVTVMVPVTVTPPPPQNYIVGVSESGAPQYGPPVVTSYNEDGSANLGQGYVMSPVGYVEAIPYTTYHQETRATNVWVPPVTLATSVSTNTPPYQPGYTIPGTPAGYYSGDTTGSVASLESVGSNDAGQLISGSATGPAVEGNRPVINETVDRWGNVLSTSDPRAAGWITRYAYNQNNQLISVTQPTSDGSGAGATSSMYYDADGREVATRDANGNVNGETYDALGDVTAEIHADGGVVRNTYNALGEKTSTTDALGNTTTYAYDNVGRLIATTQNSSVQVWQYVGQGNATMLESTGPLTERIAYDQRGNKISTTDAQGETTRYAYDMRGNVISTTDADGNVTRDAYDAEGHKVAEVDADNNAQTWKYDYFGQAQSHTDIGGAQYFYTYDNARQLVQQSNTRGMNQSFNYDVAGHVTQITDNALGQVTQYAYDAAGNRIHEVTMQNGVVYQDNHLAYDALNRLRRVEDGNVSIVYDYDANGNRTHIHTQYENVNADGVGQDQYFAYDAMNRETVADAVDPYGNITQSQGHRMTYDLNGNRISDESIGAVMASNGQKAIGTVVQNYAYDSLNRLVRTTYNGVVIDQRQYDADGRVVLSGLGSGVSQSFFDTLGLSGQVQFNEYDAAGRLLFQRNYNANWQEQDNVSYTNYDAVGNVLRYQVNSVQGTAYTNTYTNTLVRYSGYEVATQSGTSTLLQPGQTNYQYDVNGNLIAVTDTTDAANNRSFVNDVTGQILQKTQGSAVERELIANGNLVGTTGMGTDPNGVSSGPNPTFVDLTNFDPTYRPINANFPAPTPGAYTVNAGDTLQNIAQGAYGDSKLWYLIADANGLSSNNDLRVGQTLNIPNRVTDVHNSSSDFKPYDAGSVVGSTTPNLPDPPAQSDGGGCGGVLGIIVMVVVMIVTVVFQQYYALPEEASVEGAGAATEAASVLDAMATAAEVGAVSDAATQLIGDAIGTHHGFDLLETVEAAGTAMITGTGAGGGGFSSVADMMMAAAVRNAATQGIRLALHQQKSFSWAQVAESAVAAPVASEVSGLAGQALNGIDAPKVLTEFVQGAVSSTVTQAMVGGKINAASVITDGFGNIRGDDLQAAFSGNGQQAQQLNQTQQQVMNTTQVGMPGDAVMFGPMGVAGGYANPATSGTDTAASPPGSYEDAVYNQLVAAFSEPQPPIDTSNDIQLASFVRKNGEYVDEEPRSIPEPTEPYSDAPPIPDALLPQGVDGQKVFGAKDGNGNVFYVMDMPGQTAPQGKYADLFFSSAQGIVAQGSAGLDSGAITPSQYLDAVRFLVQSGAPLEAPSAPLNVEVTGTGPTSSSSAVASPPNDTSTTQGPIELNQFSSVSSMWDALTQEKNAEAAAGTYNAFSQMWHSVADDGSLVDRAVRFANVMTYQRPDAEEEIKRLFPPPTPLERTLDNIADNPLSAISTTIVYESGGSNEQAYKASELARNAWGIVGSAGFELPMAPQASRSASTSRMGGTGANGNTAATPSNLSPEAASVYAEINATRAGVQPRLPQPSNPNIGSSVRNADGSTTVTLRSVDPSLNGNTVVYDPEGFPVYAPYLYPDGINTVQIKMTGSRNSDFADANKLAGYGSTANDTPIGYTWHHHQDVGLMQLVHEDVHAMTPHTGGVAIWQRAFNAKYDSQR